MNNKAKHPMYRPAFLRMVRRDLFELAICIVLAALFVLLSSGAAFAQGNVGINNATPHAKSLLDLTSNDKGLLSPRMTSLQRIAMFPVADATAKGMLVYQTDGVQGFYYYDGAAWAMVQSGDAGWSLAGNAGTSPATNFLGTTDNTSVVFRTNNIERMRVAHTGNISIGAAMDPVNFRLYVEHDGINPVSRIRNTNAVGYSGIHMLNDLNTAQAHLGMGNSASPLWANVGYVGTTSAHPFVLTTTNQERMRIAANGNVGIGVNAPGRPLHLEGDVAGGGVGYVRNTNAAGWSGFDFGSTIAGAMAFVGFNNNFQHGYAGTGSAHPFRIFTNASARVTVATNGDVGIGTTTPGFRLQVQADVADAVGEFRNANASGWSGLHFNNNGSTARAHIGFGNATAAFWANMGYAGTTTAHPFVLTTNNSERMRIDANGNVGIGTTAPSVRLDVVDNTWLIPMRVRNTLNNGYSVTQYFNANSTAWGHVGMVNPGAASHAGRFIVGTASASPVSITTGDVERVHVAANGNVGFNMTPIYNLDLHADAQAIARFNSGNAVNGSVIELKNSGAGAFGAINFNDGANSYAGQLAYHASDGMTFRSGSVERMRIAPSGNVGIGTSASNVRLHVAADQADVLANLYNANANGYSGVHFDNNTGGRAHAGFAGSTAPSWANLGYTGTISAHPFVLTTSNAERMRIAANGNVGVGTTAPTTKLEVNGFTKLGTDAPAIKVKKLTGTTSASEGGSVGIAHGLAVGKIIGVQVLIEYGTGNWVPNGYTINPEYQVDYVVGATNVTLYNQNTNSGNVLSKPVKILVTYEE